MGAGPAGSAAASELARGGARVAVVERHGLPRHKTCGGGIVWRARQRMPLDLSAIAELECHQAELVDELGRVFRVQRAYPLVTMTMRSCLDLALIRAAQSAGAELIEGFEVRALRDVDGAIEVASPERSLRARFVVGADGAAGRTARLAGVSATLRSIPAIEWQATSPLPCKRQVARFDFRVETNGYSWLFPKADHASIGSLSTHKGEHGLAARLEGSTRALGVPEPTIHARHGFAIPQSPRPSCQRGRVLLAGDAAGLVDPVTCEGISHALDSGTHAARALLETRFDASRAGPRYSQRLRPMRAELRAARLAAYCLYEAPRLRRFLFERAGQRAAEALADLISGRTSYRRLLARAPLYLPRLTEWGSHRKELQ